MNIGLIAFIHYAARSAILVKLTPLIAEICSVGTQYCSYTADFSLHYLSAATRNSN